MNEWEKKLTTTSLMGSQAGAPDSPMQRSYVVLDLHQDYPGEAELSGIGTLMLSIRFTFTARYLGWFQQRANVGGH